MLPGDRKGSNEYNKDKPPGIQHQLLSVESHLEDLTVVIERVSCADDILAYNDPLLSEMSELRLDY